MDVLFERAYHPDPRVRKVTMALADAGYQVRILGWDRSGDLPTRDRDGAVEIERVVVRSSDGRGAIQMLYLARAVLGFVPRMRADRPAVLHAVDLRMLLVAILVAPLLGRPRIVYDAFEIMAILEGPKYPRWLSWCIGLLERILPRAADVVLAVGEERQAWFRDRGIASVVVANWIDPPVDPPSREEARESLGLPHDRPVILYAGGLDPTRDIEPLLRHAERHPEHVIVIAGRGSEEARLRTGWGSTPNVRFLGYLPDPTPVTVAADVLYYSLDPEHPYSVHAAPNNLYVAIAYAIPLVHRGQGEIGALAARHRIGAAFHDDVSLDAAIEELIQPATHAAVSAELRSLQVEYSWARARAALLSVYPRTGRTMSSPRTNGP